MLCALLPSVGALLGLALQAQAGQIPTSFGGGTTDVLTADGTHTYNLPLSLRFGDADYNALQVGGVGVVFSMETICKRFRTAMYKNMKT